MQRDRSRFARRVGFVAAIPGADFSGVERERAPGPPACHHLRVSRRLAASRLRGAPCRLNRRAAFAFVAAAALLANGLDAGASTKRAWSGERSSVAPLPGLQKGSPPWPAEKRRLAGRLRVLGFTARAGSLKGHRDVHLDIFVSGKRVTIPPGVGESSNGRYIAPVRTRDTSGVVHFAGASRLSLSDIFWVWGVRFNAHCLGGYCGGTSSSRRLRVFVDGASLHGDDPTQLPLAARMDITVTFGAVKQLPRPIPSGYRFRGG